MAGFYDTYKAIFDAIEAAIETKSSIKTVVLGEQFTMSPLPKAIISAEAAPIKQYLLGERVEAKIRGSIVLVILEHQPANWFNDIIAVMGDVVDAILADRTLGGAVDDCIPTSFIPGEIKFKEVSFYGGEIRFEAMLHFDP